jgi:hypothetical protein
MTIVWKKKRERKRGREIKRDRDGRTVTRNCFNMKEREGERKKSRKSPGRTNEKDRKSIREK